MQPRRLSSVVGAAAFALALSCGGGGAKPPPVAAAPAGPGQEAAYGPLEPVSAPRDLFAVARLRNAAKLADVSARWTSLPFDWRGLVAKALPGLERVFAFDAPVDAAAALDPSSLEPRVFWALAFGVASSDAAANYFLRQGNSVVRRSAGVYVVRLDSISCQIAPSRGAAAARVVCSDGMDSVDALAPYMTRGLPTESFGTSDAHFHISAEPFRRRYASELRLIKTMGVPFLLRELELGHPKFDRALRDAIYSLADELIAIAGDLDRIEFDSSLTPREDAFDSRMAVSMVRQQSWMAQGIVRASSSEGPPPDFFWQLPKDATAASYSVYADPEHARRFVGSLGELLDGWLDYQELGDARRRPLVAAFEEMFTIGAQSVYASVLDASPRPAPDSGDRSADSARKLLGAHIFAVDHGGERLQKFASELVKAVGYRPFRDRLVKQKLLRADQLPIARERALKGKKAAPPGSKTFEFEFAPSAFSSEPSPPPPPTKAGRVRKSDAAAARPTKAAAGSKTSVVLVAVPDGPRTWFGFGTDEALLVERLLEAKAGNGATLTLRDGVAPLRTEKAVSAGFYSLAGAVGSLDESIFGSDAFGGRKALGRLPHRGETPMLYNVRFESVGPKVTASIVVPQSVVEDIVALTVSGIPKIR